MDKVIIFGGNTTLGQIIARHLLTSGKKVTVFADEENNLKISHHNYNYIKGDVFNIYSVVQAIEANQTVISIYSYYHLWKLFYLRDALQNIVKGMNERNADRMIFFSFGEKELPGFKGDGENIVVKNLFSIGYEKKVKNILENTIRKSSLNFTINTFDTEFLKDLHRLQKSDLLKNYYNFIADSVQKQIILGNNNDREVQLGFKNKLQTA